MTIAAHDEQQIVSFRTAKAKKERLKQLADMGQRNVSFVINEAIDNHLDLYEWQVNHINKSITQARRGQFATEEQVQATFDKYLKAS